MRRVLSKRQYKKVRKNKQLRNERLKEIKDLAYNRPKASKQQRTRSMAASLRTNTPRSEKWFHALYTDFKHPQDKFNEVLGCYIPDIHNTKYKYVIEIDGSIHNRPDIQRRDQVKNTYYKEIGYEVFRIDAYNDESFKDILIKLCRYKASCSEPVSDR